MVKEDRYSACEYGSNTNEAARDLRPGKKLFGSNGNRDADHDQRIHDPKGELHRH